MCLAAPGPTVACFNITLKSFQSMHPEVFTAYWAFPRGCSGSAACLQDGTAPVIMVYEPSLHSAPCVLKWYYACERGDLRLYVWWWIHGNISCLGRNKLSIYYEFGYAILRKNVFSLAWIACSKNNLFFFGQSYPKEYTHYWWESWTSLKHSYSTMGLTSPKRRQRRSQGPNSAVSIHATVSWYCLLCGRGEPSVNTGL